MCKGHYLCVLGNFGVTWIIVRFWLSKLRKAAKIWIWWWHFLSAFEEFAPYICMDSYDWSMMEIAVKSCFLVNSVIFMTSLPNFPLRKKKRKTKLSFWPHNLQRNVSIPLNKERYFSGLFAWKIVWDILEQVLWHCLEN